MAKNNTVHSFEMKDSKGKSLGRSMTPISSFPMNPAHMSKDMLKAMEQEITNIHIESLNKKANMDINIQRGFLKRAEQLSVDKLAALRLLTKSASLIAGIPTPAPAAAQAAPTPAPSAIFPTLQPNNQAFKDLTIPRALIGAGIGGLSGGALGLISGHDDDEEDDNSTRNAILGGLAGAGMGGLVGGGFGADKYLKQQALIGIADTVARRDKFIASGENRNPAAYNKHIQQFKDVSLWNAIMNPDKVNKVMPPFSKVTRVEK